MRPSIIIALFTLTMIPIVIGSEWEWVETLDLNELMGDEHTLFKTTLSPDGNHIVWIEAEELCFHDLEENATNCYAWAWHPSFMAYQLGHRNIFMHWSPDGRYIALSQDPFLQRYDADIWIFDTIDKTFKNLTEDNFDGQTIGSLVPNNLPVDYMPLWLSRNEILFFRSTAVQDLGQAEESGYFYEGLSLMSLSIENGEINFVMDLSFEMLAGYSAAATSPSGNHLAIIGREIVDNPLTDRRFGLWVVDLENQSTLKLSSQSDWESAFPSRFTPISAYPSSNRSVGWSNDSTTIFIALTWTTAQNTLIPTQFVTELDSQSLNSIVNYDHQETDLSNQRFSFVTIIPYDRPTVRYIAISADDGKPYLYDTFSSSTNYGEVAFSAHFPDGISYMAANGNVLIDEKTILQFENLE